MWDDLLRKLHVARIELTFEAGRDGAAPAFFGSALRGAFGRALRAAACSTGAPACVGCPLTARCAYGYLFETHTPAGATCLRRYPYVPHPLVLRPPRATAGSLRAGERVNAEAILFGRGVDYLPYVLYAFGRLGEDGVGPDRTPLALVAAELHGRGRIFDGETLSPGPYGEPLGAQVAAAAAGDIALSFVSPTRIVHAGALARELPLHVVARGLLRRLSSLATFHAGAPLEVDFAGTIARAERVATQTSELRWVDQRRRSARQGREQVLGGVVGEVRYAEVPAELATLLAIGEVTHVGKATAFGLGRYERRAA